MLDLSNLSDALAPANLADTTNVVVSEKFSLRIVYMSASNQAYTAKLAEFGKKFKDHSVVKKPQDFMTDWYLQKHTSDTVSFMAHVILAGWKLTDNDGNDIPFDKTEAIRLLNTKVGKTIFGKLINACQQESTFQLGWTEDAIKN
jgi:hypothetical protein